MRSRLSSRGFTLVEVLIVVVILGILSAAVVPALGGMTDDSRQGAFVESVRGLSEACEMYRARTGQYPSDSSSGVFPAELAGIIHASDFEGGTPIGGVWDTELNDSGVGAAVGVHYDGTGESRDAAFMLEIDAMMDDGDLGTGVFRQLAADRYYVVLED